MGKYTGKRLLQLIPILIGITLLSFAMMRLAGSDAVTQKMENTGQAMSQAQLDAEREELGLDKPFLVQYGTWLLGVLHGNMGTSYVSGKPVFQTFVSKLPATLLLTLVSIVLTIVVSIPLGVLAAVKQNRFWDYFLRVCSFIGNSLPNFFVALLLMYFFAIRLGLFPVISTGVTVKNVFLPALTLAIAMSAKYLRQVRTTVLDELGKPYVTGAIARGVLFRTILVKSVLRSCLVTIITLLMLSIGSLLGGTAIVESIFMWDGVGKLAVDAVNMRDYPIIEAYVMWMAIIYVVVNLISDLAIQLLDPRIRISLGADSGQRRHDGFKAQGIRRDTEKNADTDADTNSDTNAGTNGNSFFHHRPKTEDPQEAYKSQAYRLSFSRPADHPDGNLRRENLPV